MDVVTSLLSSSLEEDTEGGAPSLPPSHPLDGTEDDPAAAAAAAVAHLAASLLPALVAAAASAMAAASTQAAKAEEVATLPMVSRGSA